MSGGGRRRILHHKLTAAAGRTVKFVERGSDSIRVLGIARGGKAQIAFTPADGRRGTRTIVALIEQAGAPAADVPVTSYSAPGPAPPGRPARVQAQRRSGTIRVSWGRVSQTKRYEVLVTLADQTQVSRVVRGSRVTIADPFPGERGTVLVDALGLDGRRGATRSARIAAVRSPKHSKGH